MADMRVNAPRMRGSNRNRAEYGVYVSLIFLFALPSALVACALHALRGDGTPGQGPIARARAEALRLAPMIFRG